MNQENRWMSLLGLANRARKVISGEELVIKEIRNNRAKVVIIAGDASENTRKKLPINAAFTRFLFIKLKTEMFLEGQLVKKQG